MKTILINLVILSLVINIGFGQEYIPFPDSNAVWSIMTFEHNINPPPPLYYDYWTNHYGITDDTVINNNVYKKLELNDDSVFYADDPSNFYYGAIRRDAETREVFYVPVDSVNESLIYDFSIEVNETILIENTSIGPVELVCTYIDSVQINGIFYRRYEIDFGTTSYWTYWIEGIGSTKNLLDTYFPFLYEAISYKLLCFQMNDSLIYHNNSWDGCYQKMVTTTSIEKNRINEFLNSNIRIIPNPVKGGNVTFMYQNTLLFSDMSLKCFDVFGREVYSEKVYQNQGTSVIDISGWQKGMYVAVVYSGGMLAGRCKFVVQ